MNDACAHVPGLSAPPFAATPDPRFAWLEAHAGAVLERVERTVREGKGGITLLTGGSGSGKTLLAQCLALRLSDDDVRVARVLHARVTPIELLQSVCDRLRVPMDGVDRHSGRDMVRALSPFLMDLYAQGRRVLLVVDEAQNLSDESLEQLRLLTNLQTPMHPLMHVLLLATPLLQARLQSANLRPLAQRITAREELAALDARECEAYVRHRLRIAGATDMPFTRLALRDLHRASRGVPRWVNRVAERALALATHGRDRVIGERLVQRAAHEVLPGRVGYWLRRHRWWWPGVAAAALALAALAWWGWRAPSTPEPHHRVNSLVATGVSPQRQAEQLLQALPPPREARLQAWSELLARWQVSSSRVNVATASACHAVIFPGFDCVGGTGTLDQLKHFDRPLVLRLATTDGTRLVLLLGAGATTVRLMVGSHPVDISRQALQQIWKGRFYAPFRLPETLPSLIRRGDQGPPVAWLAAQLDPDAADSITGAMTFDATMERNVRALQRRFGIPDDGIVGPETLFALTSRDHAGPHLAHDMP